MRLYYKRSAQKWEDTLVIGNGSLGAMIWGGAKKEHLGLNEESLWSGYYRDKNNTGAAQYLEKVRQLILNEDYQAAEKLIEKNMLGEYNESYMPLGDLFINFEHSRKIKNYERSLDIDSSTASVSYQVDENNYRREYFASYPAGAIFIKLSCDQSELNFSLSFDSQMVYNCRYNNTGLKINGKCPEHVDPSYIDSDGNSIIQGDKGMEYQAELKVISCNGSLEVGANSMDISGASKVVLAFSAVKEAQYDQNLDYEQLKQIHIKDYKSIYDKVELYLGEDIKLPTDLRLKKLRAGKKDNALYALYFQYGRYLLISSSREGSLPANLQGIWSWELRAPWSCNWTTNINVEMNYWPVQNCNLEECLEPYLNFVEKIAEAGKKTAQIHYNCRGFTHHHNADYWCNTNPVGIVYGGEKAREQSATWSMWPMGGAWLVSEFFKHYEYNPDREFLRKRVYPLLREAALFLLDWTFEYDGEYITCPSTSPENRFKTKKGGSSAVAVSTAMDLALIREVFGNFKKICVILEIEDDILAEITERLDRLSTFKIGSKGQLLEWHQEFEECEPGHRHISHLYGLFPSEIFAEDNILKEASRISLLERLENGGGHTGWSCAWVINVFAVLGDSENAFKYLKTLLTRSSYDNLWDAHPPFQIDGNFGGIAGIANMLVQDRNDEVKILPALPEEFENGHVKGLRIKKGKTIDISWSNGELDDYQIY
ncbi:alpha-L-fucosidase 2 [Halanaerobium saccharolyticum]|uniref:Alpha-L-fucosidase 2 n=1 Tax=Halanaerobium saccharolyticum TaxID=43595 RepID=A0A4V3G5D0_9FIRM|nr:glycoside hydrolase family 95 protein [Halanaerobium saccharolyticum]RAK08146.1 alpha-L-fucosidase 2 [Halanaerobium saccharolyticum]TDW04353.1 alpha-L-fucosidase 2 [Halanaerobium saccharolyticum]TDX59644.1 alpha-L-fucosidase 2 [Halanaerobium saccharolyticum]